MSESVSNPEEFLALVVDDERRIRQALTDVIEDEGWTVVGADDGHSALHILASQNPDLVLLDLWMPGLDGIETLQRMKTLKPHIPVVIMSGHGTLDTAVQATSLGAIDFLEKPLSIEKIYRLLDYARERRNPS